MNKNHFPNNGFQVFPLVDVVSGVPFLHGGVWLLPYATVTAASALPVAVDSVGVFELPKLSTDVFANGSKLYWDVTNARLTLSKKGGTPIGTAQKAAANPSSTGWVQMNAGTGPRMRTGTITIAAGASAGTVDLVDSDFDSKFAFCQYVSATGDGKIAAAVPLFKAAIAAHVLTLTLIDKDGAATVNAGSGIQTWNYVVFAD